MDIPLKIFKAVFPNGDELTIDAGYCDGFLRLVFDLPHPDGEMRYVGMSKPYRDPVTQRFMNRSLSTIAAFLNNKYLKVMIQRDFKNELILITLSVKNDPQYSHIYDIEVFARSAHAFHKMRMKRVFNEMMEQKL